MAHFQRKSYEELAKTTAFPSYSMLLGTHEWEAFRLSIINRDKKCIRCGVIIRRTENGYYRDLTSEEITLNDKKWNESPGIDLLGDGTFVVKGAKLIISGIRLVVQVHHKYYIKNMLPWEYNPDALITVCRECHEKIHASEKIVLYSDYTLANCVNTEVCATCNGTGFRKEYDYYLDGICFHCDGKGFKDNSW